MKLLRTIMAVAASAAVISGCAARGEAVTVPNVPEEKVVNLYTDRHYDSDDAIYAAFTEETGIKVNIVKGKSDELIERLKTEGEDTEADLFITADVGRLYRAQEAGLLESTESAVLEANIPENLREPEGYWFGLTKRARVIVYAKDRVDESELSTYEDLTDPKWKGRLLVRGADSVYNQTLVASLIELEGAEKAREWAEGIVANLARDPKGGDRDQAKAIASGEGDIAIMNTYYLGLMLTSSDPEEVKVAEGLGVFFPDQDGNGTHINISGGGVVKGAGNAENAVKLLEFLSGEKAQSSYAQTNFEFPVLEGAASSEFLLSLGEFKAQEISLSSLGAANGEAVRILTEAGWK